MSAWHDVPLEAGPGAYNFICEIPKESAAKMEVATVRCICVCATAPTHIARPDENRSSRAAYTTLEQTEQRAQSRPRTCDWVLRGASGGCSPASSTVERLACLPAGSLERAALHSLQNR